MACPSQEGGDQGQAEARQHGIVVDGAPGRARLDEADTHAVSPPPAGARDSKTRAGQARARLHLAHARCCTPSSPCTVTPVGASRRSVSALSGRRAFSVPLVWRTWYPPPRAECQAVRPCPQPMALWQPRTGAVKGVAQPRLVRPSSLETAEDGPGRRCHPLELGGTEMALDRAFVRRSPLAAAITAHIWAAVRSGCRAAVARP